MWTKTSVRATGLAVIAALATYPALAKPKVALPVTTQAGAIASPQFTFTLENVRITHTRSVHNDTDFASVAVAVGTNPPFTVPVMRLGDMNNGTYQLNLSIPGVAVGPNEKVALTYSVVNAGHDSDKLSKYLREGVAKVASEAATGALGDTIGSRAATWFDQNVLGIVFADCDGSVAAGEHVFSGADLRSRTATQPIVQTDPNPGMNSPKGCGSNSMYYVTWSISKG